MNNKGNPDVLKKYNASRSTKSRKLALKIIEEFKLNDKRISYTTISKASGLSRSFLSSDEVVSPFMAKLTKPSYRIKRSRNSTELLIQEQQKEINKLKKEIKENVEKDNYKAKYKDAMNEVDNLKDQLKNAYEF